MNLFDNSVTDLEETTEEAVVEEPMEPNDDIEESEQVEESETETEEVEGDDESSSEEDDVFIVDGEEFTGEQLRNAKNTKELEKSLQADYTKKTMALADERKVVESQKDKLDEMARELEVLVGEDEAVNWDELEADDPDEYIRLQKRAKLRKDALGKVKSNLKPEVKEPSKDELAAEFNTLLEDNGHWVKRDESGAVTDYTQDYKDDMAKLSKHALELGFTNDELSKINRAPIVKALLNSLKSKETSNKIEVTKKRMTPKVTKPAAKSKQVKSTSLFDKSIK